MKRLKRNAKWLLYTATVFVLGAVVYNAGAINYAARQDIITPSSVTEPVNQDPGLVAIAGELGIDIAGLNLRYEANPQPGNLAEAEAAFFTPNTIEVSPSLSIAQRRTALSHEYMHYAWTQMTREDRDNLIKTYTDFHSKDAWIKQRLAPYHDCDTECLANEANAYACTELHPVRLTGEFNLFCDQFIHNRKILFQ